MNLAKDPINLPSEFFKLSIEEQNAACEWITPSPMALPLLP